MGKKLCFKNINDCTYQRTENDPSRNIIHPENGKCSIQIYNVCNIKGKVFHPTENVKFSTLLKIEYDLPVGLFLGLDILIKIHRL